MPKSRKIPSSDNRRAAPDCSDAATLVDSVSSVHAATQPAGAFFRPKSDRIIRETTVKRRVALKVLADS